MATPESPRNKSAIAWAAVPIAIYLAVQFLVSLVCYSLLIFQPGLQPLMLSLSLLISSVATSLVLYYLVRPLALRGEFRSEGISLRTAAMSFVGLLLALFASNGITEPLELPNLMEEEFASLSRNVWGILAVGIFGPICEELVFRGGIMRPLLRGGFSPWAAILASSIVFGLVHGNPVQIVFAVLVGIAFGVVYYATRSLLVTTVVHIVNNTASILIMHAYGEAAQQLTLAGLLGPTLALVLTLVAAVASFWLLRRVYLDGRRAKE
jgi:membrane protease YdiL (CAAX protease family)